MHLRTPLLTLVCAGTLLAGPAQNAPACTWGPVAFQTFAEGTFFHLSAPATQAEAAKVSAALTQRLLRALAQGGIQTLGPILIIQRGVTPDPTRPFEMELGVLVPGGTKATGEARVRPLGAFPCATTVVTGALAEAGRAFEALFRSSMDKGRIPTGEIREMMLFWEGEASPNNMMLVQVGLQ
jgi:hypothetical protein